MNGKPPTLSVEHLSTAFDTRQGTVTVVRDVSFQVNKGEILGLVGESGSGKSVTGFSILGLIETPGKVTAGRVLFHGKDLLTLTSKEQRRLRGDRIAMIFQDPMATLNPVLRIDDQMIEAVKAHTKGVDTRRSRTRPKRLGHDGHPEPCRAPEILPASTVWRYASTSGDCDRLVA